MYDKTAVFCINSAVKIYISVKKCNSLYLLKSDRATKNQFCICGCD